MSESIRQKCQKYKISDQDYESILKLLCRSPQGVEWALFSALWSEHCSYKSSKRHLKKFFSSQTSASFSSQGSRTENSVSVLRSFGENAGVIDLGQGERLAFKIESHNHPSFIEPFQGAATGVGGILRDIFTMGARPIALANFLCFGRPEAPRMKFLIQEVVRGIGSYGNCVGVPTVTGQTEFHSSYDNNILVNALALGLFSPKDRLVSSCASGEGNDVVYVGAKTGRDGLQGAVMSSESFVSSESLKSTVQVGDPFLENLLIESCLEVIKKGLVVAMQDMGAAGLASSSFEMASKGGVGLSIELDKIPLRDSSLGAEEILLSESQERMLLISKPEHFEDLKSSFKKWNLEVVRIGRVLKERKVSLLWEKEEICSIDPDILVKKSPSYDLPYRKHIKRETKAGQRGAEKLSLSNLDFSPCLSSEEVCSILLDILRDPSFCSREFIYKQYDQRVGGKTERDASENFAVLRLPHSQRSLGLILGGRPHVIRWDPREGGIDALVFPHLELAIKGFRTLAATDCLNFGDPNHQEVMTEFVACVEALSETSQSLDIPIVSGNVSFYNETKAQNTRVTSTPVIGLIGLRDSYETLPSSYFNEAGGEIFLIQIPQVGKEGVWTRWHKWKKGGGEEKEAHPGEGVGFLSPDSLFLFSKWLRKISVRFPISASCVVGKGGLIYSLARMCVGRKMEHSHFHAARGGGRGCEVELSDFHHIFKEVFYQVILVLKKESQKNSEDFQEALSCCPLKEVECKKIGRVKGEFLSICSFVNISVDDLRKAYFSEWKGYVV